MATIDDILGNGGGTPPPKGSKEWHEQQQDASAPNRMEQQPAAAPAVTSSRPETTAQDVPASKDVGTGTDVSQVVERSTAVPEYHGNVVREFGDGIHAFMEDGTIRTKGWAGYTYSNPGENVSNVDLFKALNPYKPPTAEELEKEKKKQKRDQIFAAIGDGISALSNLYFTTKGAPSMYTGRNTISERTKVRYDTLMKEREGREKEYYAGLMRARMADEERNDRERKWQRQLGLDDYNRKRDDAKEERDKQMFELNLQLQGNKISAAEADAKRKGIEAKYAERLEEARLETEKAKAGASKARAQYYNNGGSGGKAGEYPWYDSEGNKHFAHSYEAMRQNSIDNGTWNEKTQASTTEVKSGRGKTIKISETTKPDKGHSSKPQKKSPTADNKKKSPTS